MATLKLRAELPELVNRINNRREEIINHGKYLKSAKEYNKFEIRFMFDVFNCLYGWKAICDMHKKYGTDSKHEESLIRKAFEQCKISIKESDY